jgi:hypothetical protein
MKHTPRRSFPICLRKRLALNRSLFCLSGEGAAPPNTLRSSAGFFTITELRACIKKNNVNTLISFFFFNFQCWRKSQVCREVLKYET